MRSQWGTYISARKYTASFSNIRNQRWIFDETFRLEFRERIYLGQDYGFIYGETFWGVGLFSRPVKWSHKVVIALKVQSSIPDTVQIFPKQFLITLRMQSLIWIWTKRIMNKGWNLLNVFSLIYLLIKKTIKGSFRFWVINLHMAKIKENLLLRVSTWKPEWISFVLNILFLFSLINFSW